MTKTQNQTKHSVASLNQLIDTVVVSSIQQCFVDNVAQMEVIGKLGEIQETAYPVAYGIQLTDDDAQIPMNIKKSLLLNFDLRGGEYVKVIGTLIPKRDQYTKFQVVPVLNVSYIEPIESPTAIAARRKDQANLETLKLINPERHIFPFKTKIKLSILRARQSEVILDFMQELDGLSSVSVEEITVNMTSAEEIAAAVLKSTGDVLVILRGGGNSNEFECFNTKPLLTAINKFQGYRILGIGHASYTTLADCVCDYSASAPARAGMHIKEMFSMYSSVIQAETSPIDNAKRNLEQSNSSLNELVVGLGSKIKDLEKSKKLHLWIAIVVVIVFGIVMLKMK